MFCPYGGHGKNYPGREFSRMADGQAVRLSTFSRKFPANLINQTMNPLFIIIGAGILLSWLASSGEETKSPDAKPDTDSGNIDPPAAEGETTGNEIPVSQSVTLDVLREIFENGARPLKRRDAVELLKGAPYFIPKTNAYRALAPSRRFATHLREDADGWLHFNLEMPSCFLGNRLDQSQITGQKIPKSGPSASV